jgi:hypothetical protein
MSVSFQRLWENMQTQRLKEADQKDSKAMEAIRTGINVSEDFWDNFLQVINNSEALSELLDVPTTKIGSWHSKINDALSKVKQADEGPEVKKKNKMINTGEPDPEEKPLFNMEQQ